MAKKSTTKKTSKRTIAMVTAGTVALVATGAGGYGVGVSTSDGLRDAAEDYAMEQKDYDNLESVIISLKIRESDANIPDYSRDSLPTGWLDLDGNSCNTREDMLVSKAMKNKKVNDCKIISGTFYDYYTGKFIRFDGSKAKQGGGIHIDHMVSLGNAWISGGYKWQKSDGTINDEKWKEFINYESNLIITSDETNIRKSDKDITEWQPTNESYLCEYMRTLVETKKAYSLTITPEEKDAFLRILKNNCKVSV